MKQKRLKFQTKQSLNYLVREKNTNEVVWIRNQNKPRHLQFDLWFDYNNNINKKASIVRASTDLAPLLKRYYE